MEKVLRNKLAIFLFIFPALLAYSVVVFYPMIQSIIFTFFEGTPHVDFKFVGFDNYAKLWGDKSFKNSLAITLQYMLIVGAGWSIIGLVTALLFEHGLKNKFVIDLARTIVYLPVVIPGVGIAAMFLKIYEVEPNLGMFNSLLSMCGLGNLVQPWIGQASTALPAMAVADIWRGYGYYTIIFYAGLINIPRELEEAAEIDGCNVMQTITHIILPLLRPVTVMCIVLAVNNALRVYDMPAVMTRGGPGRSTLVLSMYMYRTAFNKWQYGYGSAIAVVMLVLSLALARIISAFDRKKELQ